MKKTLCIVCIVCICLPLTACSLFTPADEPPSTFTLPPPNSPAQTSAPTQTPPPTPEYHAEDQAKVDLASVRIPVVEGEAMLDTVGRWAEAYRQAVLARPEGTPYYAIDMRIIAVNPNDEVWEEAPDVHTVGFAIKVPEGNQNLWLVGNAASLGEGEYEGWIVTGGYINLSQENGKWYTDALFSGR